MTNENPVPTTFPEALAAIEADNAGPRPISEAVDVIVLKAQTMGLLREAIWMAEIDCWIGVHVLVVRASELIAKMGVVP